MFRLRLRTTQLAISPTDCDSQLNEMRPPKQLLKKIIAKLSSHYKQTTAALPTDPFQIIIFENIGYLVDDERRALAFAALRDRVGLQPADIVTAQHDTLVAIAKLGGIHPDLRAHRLREIAHIVLNDFDGDLNNALRLPLPKAIKAFQKFPSIGVPGAEKILLFTKTHPILALDSNGLRVLLRLGFGEEKKSYSASYASVREALADQIGSDCDFLIMAHELLRQHGKELCKRSAPRCEVCPLRRDCNYCNDVA